MSKDNPRRQIVIETDGKDIFLIKNETTPLEMAAILERLLRQLDNNFK